MECSSVGSVFQKLIRKQRLGCQDDLRKHSIHLYIYLYIYLIELYKS